MPTPRQTVVLCLTAGALAAARRLRRRRRRQVRPAGRHAGAYDAFARHADSSKYAPRRETCATHRTARLGGRRRPTRQGIPGVHRATADGKWTQEARIRVENFNVLAAAATRGGRAVHDLRPAAVSAAAAPVGAAAATAR